MTDRDQGRRVMARAFVLAVLATALAIGYLFQQRYSVRLTARVVALQKQRQLAAERLDEVSVAVARLEDFGRLDSLGRTRPVVAATQAAGGPGLDRLTVAAARPAQPAGTQ